MLGFLTFIILASLIFAYFFWGMVELDLNAPLCTWFSQPENRMSTFIVLVALTLLTVGVYGRTLTQGIFLYDMSSEMIGISFTILILDQLNLYRQKFQRKREIIDQIGSYSNAFALDAVRLASLEKWLSDGSLNKANFSEADLSHAPLYAASLRKVNLRRAQLIDACLMGSDLCEADLSYGILCNAKLQNAQLHRANLHGANLSCAQMSGARLIHADITEADLRNANLSFSNLSYANLREAQLQNADFSGACLCNANLSFVQRDEKTQFSMAEYNDQTNWGQQEIPVNAVKVASCSHDQFLGMSVELEDGDLLSKIKFPNLE